MSKDNRILIRKASGEEEEFSVQKLEQSLINAGAKQETIQRIIDDINGWIRPGTTTRQLYQRAFAHLRKERTAAGMRYKLKRAMLELGPSGYPFETLIGELFKHQGFQTEVGIVVYGKCITHEMDVIATKDKEQHLVECKYHHDQGKQVSIQVPLYVKSRVEDIADTRYKLPEFLNFKFHTWVVTNTRFSSDSIHFSKCCGLHLLAWDYPVSNGLKEQLEKFKIYPITILHSMTRKEKHHLMEQGIVTCRQLSQNLNALDELNISQRKLRSVKNELDVICPLTLNTL